MQDFGEWRLVPRTNSFLIYDGGRQIAHVSRRLERAEFNARTIAKLPQLLDAGRIMVDGYADGMVTSASVERMIRLVVGTEGCTDGPWRARGLSVWGVGRQRLIAKFREEEVAVAASGAPDIVQAIEFALAACDAQPVRRISGWAVPQLREVCWHSRFTRFWRLSERRQASQVARKKAVGGIVRGDAQTAGAA